MTEAMTGLNDVSKSCFAKPFAKSKSSRARRKKKKETRLHYINMFCKMCIANFEIFIRMIVENQQEKTFVFPEDNHYDKESLNLINGVLLGPE